MERKRIRKRENKVPRGIALRPPLWERIDTIADAQDKSRNEVIEAVLEAHIPSLPDFRNSHSATQSSGETRDISLVRSSDASR